MDRAGASRHLGAALLTAGLLSTVGLAACTDDPTPKPSSTSAPSAVPNSTSPTASPAPTPPTAPKAEPTPKSAEAFVKYFWAVHNYAYATLDLETFKAISEPGCTFCSSTIDDIQALQKAGTRTEGSFIRPSVIAAPPGKITTGIIVAGLISQDPGRAIHSDGTVRLVPAMAKRRTFVSLNWRRNEWHVDDVALDKSGKVP